MAENVEEGPPRVFIGYVDGELLAETRTIGEAMGATFCNFTGDDEGYFRLFERLWARGESFINLEQDVVPTPELLREMWACPAEWCSAFFYLYDVEALASGETRPQRPERYRIAGTLALHRFSSTLLRRTPDAMQLAVGGSAQRRYHTMLDLALTNPDGILHGAPYFARPHLHGPVEQPTRDVVRPAWVPLVAEAEWVETGDYEWVDPPEPPS